MEIFYAVGLVYGVGFIPAFFYWSWRANHRKSLTGSAARNMVLPILGYSCIWPFLMGFRAAEYVLGGLIVLTGKARNRIQPDRRD